MKVRAVYRATDYPTSEQEQFRLYQQLAAHLPGDRSWTDEGITVSEHRPAAGWVIVTVDDSTGDPVILDRTPDRAFLEDTHPYTRAGGAV